MARRASEISPLLIAAGLALLIVLVSLPSFLAAGPEMDEGTLVAYPSLVSEHGLVPGRDFETFYGPGQPYLLAGLGQVFGLSQTLERLSGLAFELVIALSLFVCALPAGRWLAAIASLAAALIMLDLGIVGLALLGALAALMAGLAILLTRPPPASRAGRRDLMPVLAGVLAAVAVTMRPDFAPVAVLSAAPLLLWPVRGSLLGADAKRWSLALVIGLIPLVAWLIVVGPDDLTRLVDDLRSSRGGRSLPLPSVTSAEAGLLAATGLTMVGAAIAAFALLRADPFDRGGRTMLAIALLLVALMPATLERADNAHVFPVAAIAIGLAPLVVRELAALRVGVPATALLTVAVGVVALAAAHAAVVVVRAQASELSASERGVRVSNGDRSFRVGDRAAAADLNALIPEVERRTQPGDSIFVGPSDLTRTFYADTFLYYLFDKLRPASIYTELNAGTANGDDSELADELEQADVLVLTDRYVADTAAAGEAGNDAAQRVLDGRFCRVARHGSYQVLVPCDTLRYSASPAASSAAAGPGKKRM